MLNNLRAGNGKTYLLSLLAGAIYPLGFAPFGYWPFAVLSVAIIFSVWSRSERRSTALWSALYYGLALYCVGVSWVYVSMVNFGGMVPVMAAIAVVLFALFLSIYFIVPVYLYTLVAPRLSKGARLVILLPALWVLFEWLRGTLFTGFAWLYLGYTSVDTWFSAWGTLAGVSLVSYIFALIAGLLAFAYDRWKSPCGLKFSMVLKISAAVGALALVSVVLQGLRWTEQVGDPLDVTLIQADVPLSDKWRPEKRQELMQMYLAASKTVEQADLIVWPEAALPMFVDQVPPDYLKELSDLTGTLAFGVVQRDRRTRKMYNGLAVLNDDEPTAQGMQMYRKRHLVPFGEFFPLKSVLGWLFETLEIPMSDFSSGSDTQGNLKVRDIMLVPTICYEDAYPEDWRRQVAEAGAILNMSEDAWFGDSFAPHQRLEMARMRAIEFQRPVIRISNNGLSTVIDPRGEMDAISPQFQPALFRTPVFPMQGKTPYMRYGQWPLWIWLALSVLSGFVFFRQKNTR